MRSYQIAIDGPAGSGKSTVAKIIAKKLGIVYLDTGAMYRAVTLATLRMNKSVHSKEDLKEVVDHIKLGIQPDVVYIDGEDVSEEIRSPEISSNVSYVAMDSYVRMKMVEIQREIADNTSVVMDGRDIGTHVLPNAEFKFFLVASVEERAKRRYLELEAKGYETSVESLIEDIAKRDLLDSTREASPLLQAEDARLVDTTQLSITEVSEYILDVVLGGL